MTTKTQDPNVLAAIDLLANISPEIVHVGPFVERQYGTAGKDRFSIGWMIVNRAREYLLFGEDSYKHEVPFTGSVTRFRTDRDTQNGMFRAVRTLVPKKGAK